MSGEGTGRTDALAAVLTRLAKADMEDLLPELKEKIKSRDAGDTAPKRPPPPRAEALLFPKFRETDQ